MSDYQQRLVRTLPSQGDVTFSNTQTYPGRVLCGQYTSLTEQGYSYVTREYVITSSRVITRPRDDEQRVFCSDDPAASLYDYHGIGGPDANWSVLAQLRDDLRAIDAAIVRYHSTTATMPRRLEDLLSGDYGLDADRLRDPWQRDYFYEAGLAGRTTPQYTLRSLGADGVPGGRGAAADVGIDELEMLDHVLGLRPR